MSLAGRVSRGMVTVVWVFLAVTVFVTTAEECTQENVNECLEPFKTETANATSSSPIVPTRTEEEMRQMCDDYDDFAECMAPIKPNCGEVDQLVFEGYDNYYEYFCDEKFDEYLKYRECFKTPELHEEGKYCNTTFTTRLASLRDQDYSTSYIRDRICQYVEDYLDCVENVVTSFCGAEAALWQRGLDVTSLMPLLNRISCPGWPSADKYDWRLPKDTTQNSVIIIVVVFFLILLLAVGALIAMKLWQMKSRPRQTRPDESAAPPYASYDGNGVYMYATGLPPVEGATAGPLPTKAPPYPESSPPEYQSRATTPAGLGYDNPVYGVTPGYPPTGPISVAAAPPEATTEAPVNSKSDFSGSNA